MLNPFGADYTPHVIRLWLTEDPSLPCALAIGLIVWIVGKRVLRLQVFVAPIFASFLPLSLWIWDVPLSGRFICRHFHDGRLALWGIPVTARYFYMLGLVLYVTFVWAALRKRKKEGERRRFPKTDRG
jgi:hypothetical protein